MHDVAQQTITVAEHPTITLFATAHATQIINARRAASVVGPAAAFIQFGLLGRRQRRPAEGDAGAGGVIAGEDDAAVGQSAVDHCARLDRLGPDSAV